MIFKGLIAASAAVMLAVTPAVAASSSAAALSVAPAAEKVDGSELRGGFIIPAIAVIAIILGILAATGGGNEAPHSP